MHSRLLTKGTKSVPRKRSDVRTRHNAAADDVSETRTNPNGTMGHAAVEGLEFTPTRGLWTPTAPSISSSGEAP